MKFLMLDSNFKDAFAAVRPFVAHDEARPAIGGILMQAEGRKMTLTALDKYNLCRMSIPLTEPVDGAPVCRVIPALDTVFRPCGYTLCMDVGEDSVTVHYRGGNTVVSIPAELRRNDYPPVQKIVPTREHLSNEPMTELTLSFIALALKAFPKKGVVRVENYGKRGVIYRGERGYVLTLPAVPTDPKRYYDGTGTV